jgi:hypothetical protein
MKKIILLVLVPSGAVVVTISTISLTTSPKKSLFEQQLKQKSAPAAKKKGHGNSPSYTRDERMFLFTIIAEIRPIDGNEWDYVLERHNEVYEHKGRDVTSIRPQFTEYKRKKVPTGNPNCPDDVKANNAKVGY